MADETNSAAGAATPPVPPKIQILNQYIRDLSFENLAMQKGKMPEGKTAFKVQVALDARKMDDGNYEVINKLNISGMVNDENIFLIELDYAGRFSIENVAEAQLHPILMVECPRLMFPYMRRVVGDITRDGGYPPLNLDNIDYVTLYRNEINRRVQEQAKNAPIS